MFCVECGTDGTTFEGLCAACFLQRRKLTDLPENLDISTCSSCGAVLVGKTWKEVEVDDAICELVGSTLWLNPALTLRGVEVSTRAEDACNILANVTVKVELGDTRKGVAHLIRARIKRGTCPQCAKRHGMYYEAILQVRPESTPLSEQSLDDIKKYVRERVGSQANAAEGCFLSKEEEVHGGVDFYVSSNAIARAIAKELAKRFRGTLGSSPRLHGMVRGKEVYRVTYIVRIP